MFPTTKTMFPQRNKKVTNQQKNRNERKQIFSGWGLVLGICGWWGEPQPAKFSNQFHITTSGQQILPWGQNFVAVIWNLAVRECSCTYCRDTPARRAKILIRARRALLQNAYNVQAKLSTGKLAGRPCKDYYQGGRTELT